MDTDYFIPGPPMKRIPWFANDMSGWKPFDNKDVWTTPFRQRFEEIKQYDCDLQYDLLYRMTW